MWYDPARPLHDRYQVRHDFLDASLGREIVTIAQLIDAFFRWELNSCEVIVRGGEAQPIDYANASPDLSLIEPPLLLPVGDPGARSPGRRSAP